MLATEPTIPPYSGNCWQQLQFFIAGKLLVTLMGKLYKATPSVGDGNTKSELYYLIPMRLGKCYIISIFGSSMGRACSRRANAEPIWTLLKAFNWYPSYCRVNVSISAFLGQGVRAGGLGLKFNTIHQNVQSLNKICFFFLGWVG